MSHPSPISPLVSAEGLNHTHLVEEGNKTFWGCEVGPGSVAGLKGVTRPLGVLTGVSWMICG